MGVSIGSIIDWESGKYKPRAEKVAKLSELEKGGKVEAGEVPKERRLAASPRETEESKAEQPDRLNAHLKKTK